MKTYDPKCWALADVFLFDHPEINTDNARHRLASHLQTEIEEWIELEKAAQVVSG